VDVRLTQPDQVGAYRRALAAVTSADCTPADRWAALPLFRAVYLANPLGAWAKNLGLTYLRVGRIDAAAALLSRAAEAGEAGVEELLEVCAAETRAGGGLPPRSCWRRRPRGACCPRKTPRRA
jgi:hypothetical protein